MFGTEQTRSDYKRILRSLAGKEAYVAMLFKGFSHIVRHRKFCRSDALVFYGIKTYRYFPPQPLP
jgi:hypothetical protein